ncbi:MAG: sugar ABC transporter ATP-binding protein, partial [Anaerobutyricum sp.]|nr:sugar ABC transporter ATP-binding protein [Anaerobutyricum sp.]
EVFDIINQYADRGLSIMCVSSELKEMLAIATRVIVLSNGIKTAEFTGDDITEDNLVLASYKGHHMN